MWTAWAGWMRLDRPALHEVEVVPHEVQVASRNAALDLHDPGDDVKVLDRQRRRREREQRRHAIADDGEDEVFGLESLDSWSVCR